MDARDRDFLKRARELNKPRDDHPPVAPRVWQRHGTDGEPVESHGPCHPTIARIRAARFFGGAR